MLQFGMGDSTDMAGKVFAVTIVPRWADIDLNRHMRHSAFADWAGYARSEWLDAHRLSMQILTDLKVAPILFEESTRYFKEIFIGERITIELQLAGANHDGSRWRLRHTLRRGETVCAVHEAGGAWFDVVTRRIAPPPPGLREAYADMMRTDDYVELVSNERVVPALSVDTHG
jgi:acyl-CoA thioester hydrolase